jgi:hypothetical protein
MINYLDKANGKTLVFLLVSRIKNVEFTMVSKSLHKNKATFQILSFVLKGNNILASFTQSCFEQLNFLKV